MLYRNELIEILHYNDNYYGIKEPTNDQTVMAIDVIALPQIIKYALMDNHYHHSFYIDLPQSVIEKRMKMR
jgi:predicted alternative tryptophan synthase beta-subunit